MMRWLNGITNSIDINWNKLGVIVKVREAWCADVYSVAESGTTELLNNKVNLQLYS